MASIRPVLPTPAHPGQLRGGVLAGCAAFSIWGISPLYWKMLSGVPALEIILHRVIWSFLALMAAVFLRKEMGQLRAALSLRSALPVLTLTAILVSANWLLYVWSVNSGHIIQASLGYYINPLVNVCLGILILGERLRRLQGIAVLLACSGVVVLTVHHGTVPWIALALALLFSLYGLFRKTAPVGALVGLTVETGLLSIPATIYLAWLRHAGSGFFLNHSGKTDLLLVGAGLVTALPLLLFNMATRRLAYTTVGLIQYIAPTGMFLLGVFVYHEPFSRYQVIAFLLIWAALALYTLDSMVNRQAGIEGTG